MNNLSVLGANDEYVQQTKKYGKRDALLALVLYVVMTIDFIILGYIFVHKDTALTETYVFWTTGLASLFLIGLVLLFCFLQRQSLVTIGFSKTKAKNSLGVGLVLLMVVIILKAFTTNNYDLLLKADASSIAMSFIYYFVFIAFMEEIAMRGYIGTRLYGYFRDKRLSIVIVGILFSLEHIPFHMTMAHMGILDYILANWGDLIKIFLLHVLFQWLYSKYNSIIGPIIFHFIIDFTLL